MTPSMSKKKGKKIERHNIVGNDAATTVIVKFARVARPFITEAFGLASCIPATKITIEIMRRFGIDASPFPCQASASNADKTWKVGIGVPNPTNPGRTVGHLVAIVAGCYLVDASIDQASRPEKGIWLPPILVTTTFPEFLREEEGITVPLPNGNLVHYHSYRKSRVWETSRAWTDASHTAPSVNRIIAALKGNP